MKPPQFGFWLRALRIYYSKHKIQLLTFYYWLVKQKKTILYLAIILFVLSYFYIFKMKFGNEANYKNYKTYDMESCEKGYQTIVEIWKEILTVSDEQKLISPDIILKTAKFMIEERPEDDPELIEFVRSIIVPPSKEPISLERPKKTDQSQLHQSRYIDEQLGKKRNGFFVEAGGFDGEIMSNSLFFELNRNWTGILIEPVPSHFQRILSKNRNIYAINACIGGKKTFLAKFRVFTVFSGRYSELNLYYLPRIEYEKEIKNVTLIKTAYIPCFPLYTILKAINVSQVNYFSLDVEGGEWSVIDSLSFDKIHIDALTVEWASAKNESKDLILNKLTQNNYEFLKQDIYDLYFKRRS